MWPESGASGAPVAEPAVLGSAVESANVLGKHKAPGLGEGIFFPQFPKAKFLLINSVGRQKKPLKSLPHVG